MSDTLLRVSDRNARNGEDMMDILVHDIIRERSERMRIHGYTDIVTGYTANIFRRMFRLQPETFEKLLTYIQDFPCFQVKGVGRPAITTSKQLLMTLWYLGGQDTIQKIADRFGVSESSVITCRDRVIDALLSLRDKFIKWPIDREIPHEIMCFAQRNGFPCVLGALDGTHIRIKAPTENGQAYVNRKKYHSVQLQAVCKHDMVFTHCYAGHPGGWHDARVLRNSDLWDEGLALCVFEHHILADAAYPLRRWILTPYRDNGHLTAEHKHYNHLQSANRVVIERAFGLLKGRFRRLSFVETKLMKDTVNVVMVCCVLHNICLLSHEECDEFMQDDEEGGVNGIPAGLVAENEAEGALKRNLIARRLNN